MLKSRILVAALVLAAFGAPVHAQAVANPIAAAAAANAANITANGQGKITAPVLNATINAVIAAIASVASIGTYGAGGAFALNASAITPPPDFTLSGVAPIPGGSNSFCAAGGSILTLPIAAAPGTVEVAENCDQTAFANPVSILASADRSITEGSPYPLKVNGQVTGFRATATGQWQPF